MARNDKFVMYCKDQINSEDSNVSESGVFGMFKVSEDLRGKKRVLKFMSKCMELIELTMCDEVYEFCDEDGFEEAIRGEADFYEFGVVVGDSQIEYVIQVQKLFNHKG